MFSTAISEPAAGLVLLNLAKIVGRQAVCDRIPATPGVYAFFRRYEPPPAETALPAEFANYIVEEVSRVHCIPRTGSIPPLYEVELRSRKQLSDRKKRSLESLCESAAFRTTVVTVLRFAMFFEQPLYVGKAAHLPTRIGQHLASDSVLRSRLQAVDIDIDRTALVCLPIEPSRTVEAGQAGADGEVPLSEELVLEEVVSKLFHPLFTERYG